MNGMSIGLGRGYGRGGSSHAIADKCCIAQPPVLCPGELCFPCSEIRSMLSEKAKGKQRAVDPELDGEPSRTESRNLTIRFTEGISDLVLFVTSTDAVRDVKTKVRRSLETEACL